MLSFFRQHKGLSAIFVFLIVFILAGCSKPQKKPAKSPPKPKIGFSMAAMEGDGYTAFKKEVDKGKTKEKVDVIWKDAKNDPMEQAVNVDDLIKSKVKAIILQPVDPKQAQGLVKKVTQGKIKVLALEEMPSDVHLDGLITPDFTRAGEFQGKLLAEKAATGKVIVFTVKEDDPNSIKLWEGFRTAIDQSTGLEIVRYTVSALAKAETAKVDIADAMSKYPDAKAVVAQSSTLTEALMDALKEKPPAGKLITIGIGAGKKAIIAISEGKHTGEVDTRPEFLGDYALKGAAQLAGGKTLEYDKLVNNGNIDVPTRIIPVRMITKENLYLMEERWGKEMKKAKEEGKKGQEKGKGSSGGSSSGGSGSKSGGGSGDKKSSQGKDKQAGGKKTKLKITTKEGKTVEVQIDGEIKKIETETPQGGGGQSDGGGGKSGRGGGASGG